MKKIFKVFLIIVVIFISLIIVGVGSLFVVGIYYDKIECKSDAECPGNQYCALSRHYGLCDTDMPLFCASGQACIERYCPKGMAPLTCNFGVDKGSKYFPAHKKTAERRAWINEPYHYCVDEKTYFGEIEKLREQTGRRCDLFPY